jgi:amino-acid N-acetyltransferase
VSSVTTPELATPLDVIVPTIRKATMADIQGLLKLINGYAGDGVMLPRTEFEMSENIRDFSVAYVADRLVGCGALHFYTPTSGEVRSLAVDPAIKTHGMGRLMVDALEQEAVDNQLHAIFAFTYVPGFFQKMGFREVERGELPLKVWKDCLRCPKFSCCDEIAMVKALRPDPVFMTAPEPDTTLVQLPNVAPRTPAIGLR